MCPPPPLSHFLSPSFSLALRASPCAPHFKTTDKSGVQIVRDNETHENCLLINSGSLSIDVPTASSRRYLAIYLKNLKRFTELQLEVYDSNGAVKTITFGNHQSVIRIQPNAGECRLPMTLKPSWNYLNIDLQDITEKAFGVGFHHCHSISISAHCAVWKIYFQDRPHAESELPKSLQIS